MDTHPQQLEGLEITYEDCEPGFTTANGVARTSEVTLWAVAATPSRQRLVDMAHAVQTLPLLSCQPEHYHATGVFGAPWTLPDRSTPARTKIEDQLDWHLGYYQKQVTRWKDPTRCIPSTKPRRCPPKLWPNGISRHRKSVLDRKTAS